MLSDSQILAFVDDWVAFNVRRTKGPAISSEVNRLAAGITADARELGISGGDMHRIVGDLDDYLTERCDSGTSS